MDQQSLTINQPITLSETAAPAAERSEIAPAIDLVYNFWFGEHANTYAENYKMNTKLWFRGNAEIDSKISLLFKELMENTAKNPVTDNALDSLCSIILLDQFPRHIYRGTANAFKYDHIALQIAEKIINQNWINDLSPIEALFVYFTFVHQESIEYAQKSIIGFQNLSIYTVSQHSKIIQSFKKSACRHLEILEQFGRYPHRNEALSRTSTPVELDFLKKHGNSIFMKSQQLVRLHKEVSPSGSGSGINSDVSTIKKRFKILCLHGWRQNGKIFKMRTKKLVRELGDMADFHFVTSPINYEPQGDALEATLSAYESVPDYSNQRVWWISSEGNKYYQSADISLAYLEQIWKKEGPFDGVLGFAQGGTMAAIMSCKGFNPQFLILISSYVPRADEFKYMDVVGSLKTPSIHILGQNDILVIPERSRNLHQLFVSGKLVEHAGGHFTPKYWPYNEMRLFISQFTPLNTNVNIVGMDNDIDWVKLIQSVNSDNVVEISEIIAKQLQKDFDIGYNIQQTYCTDKFHFDKPENSTGFSNSVDRLCPSKCVDAMIGRTHSINKKYKLLKLIAAKLFPTFDEVKRNACLFRATQILRKMRYRVSPEYNDKITNHYIDARSSEKRIKMLENEPPSHYVINPKPEPVVACSLEELKPLIEFLENDYPVNATSSVTGARFISDGVNQQMQFAKGTITTDGRLDLCKQVVGPLGIGPVLNAMNKASSVKRLLLGNNIVGNSGAEAIGREMKVSKLECWYIAGNEFTSEGIVHIASALKNNQYCTSLWLKRNPLGPLSMNPIADMLLVNQKIQVLDLVNCGILDSGLETLLEGLTGRVYRNRTLRVLWLDTNAITYKSANIIADYLSNECELIDLSLSCNRLCDSGVEIIAKALSMNNTLQRVSLASNRIGPTGAKYLSDALKFHSSINYLNLGYTRSTDAVHELGNFIGDEGAFHMAELLKNNSTIRHLDLLHNSISQTGVNHIISALETNTTLVKLQLTQFKMVHNEPGKEYIKEKLTENYSHLNSDERAIVDKMIMPWYIEDIYSVYRTKS